MHYTTNTMYIVYYTTTHISSAYITTGIFLGRIISHACIPLFSMGEGMLCCNERLPLLVLLPYWLISTNIYTHIPINIKTYNSFYMHIFNFNTRGNAVLQTNK